MKINVLTREEAQRRQEEILGLEKYINNIGGPDWTSENLFKDLPEKWKLSFYITNETNNIIAYIISSNRNNIYHMHRVFIIPELRKRLTFTLIRHTVEIANQNGFDELSWKIGEGIESFESSFKIADRYGSLGRIDNHDFYMFYKNIKGRKI